MTGNTVLLAIALSGHGEAAVKPLVPIVAFFFGAMIAGALLIYAAPALLLVLEAALLAAAALFRGYAPGLGLLALAMGIQNTAISKFGGVRANTSFITGDYVQVAKALAEIVAHFWCAPADTLFEKAIHGAVVACDRCTGVFGIATRLRRRATLGVGAADEQHAGQNSGSGGLGDGQQQRRKGVLASDFRERLVAVGSDRTAVLRRPLRTLCMHAEHRAVIVYEQCLRSDEHPHVRARGLVARVDLCAAALNFPYEHRARRQRAFDVPGRNLRHRDDRARGA
jgi:hypothetical protein